MRLRSDPRLVLWVLLFSAAAAGAAWRPGLHSLDDCFYAEKGREALETSSFFTVRWNGTPNWQNPPLQFFWIAQSFRFFGRNDLAARLPQILMATLLLPMTWWIARRLGLAASVASFAVALLATTPLLVANASRVMLDIPAAFWCTTIVASWLLLRDVRHVGARAAGDSAPAWAGALLLAVSIAGAMLTKSVLGLLGVGIVAVAAVLERRRPEPVAIVAAVAGLCAGSSWWVHQRLVFGPTALEQHFLSEILQRSAASLPLHERLLGYPRALVEKFEPWVIPAYCGAFVLLRRPELRRGPLALIATWLLLPPIVLVFSAAQRPSYLYPILPAIAIASAWWIERRWPRAAHVLVRWVLPALLVCVGVLRIAAPRTLGREHNRTLAREAARVAAAIPTDRPVPSYHVSYWRVANPLVYYARRSLATPSDSVTQAVRAARAEGGVLMCGPGEVDAVRALAPDLAEVARDRDWTLVRVGTAR